MGTKVRRREIPYVCCMTAREAHQLLFQAMVKRYPVGEAQTITRWALEFCLHIPQAALIRDPDQEIAASLVPSWEAQVEALRAGKPIQYVIERAWFMDMELFVSPAVLIPRPETEELAEQVIRVLQEQNNTTRVLDVGTGSGCLALSIARNCKKANVIGLDSSLDALDVARINQQRYPCDNLQWIQQDFLDEQNWSLHQPFDVIVSNPPYIPLHEKQKLDEHVVRYEPALALFVPNESPWLFYDKLAVFATTQLNPGGHLWVEVHEDLARETAYLFDKQFTQVNIHRDTFGKQRMVEAAGKI